MSFNVNIEIYGEITNEEIIGIIYKKLSSTNDILDENKFKFIDASDEIPTGWTKILSVKHDNEIANLITSLVIENTESNILNLLSDSDVTAQQWVNAIFFYREQQSSLTVQIAILQSNKLCRDLDLKVLDKINSFRKIFPAIKIKQRSSIL